MVKNIVFSNGRETLDVMNDDRYLLTSVDGLSPSANVFTTSNAVLDGSTFESSISDQRNINLTVRVNPQHSEAAKRYLYRVFANKSWGFMRYVSENVDFTLEYQVEFCRVNLTDFPMTAQISIIAPSYYFERFNRKRIPGSGVVSMWEFPWEIPDDGFEFAKVSYDHNVVIFNDGEVPTGARIEIIARGNMSNPVIRDINTFEFIKINASMAAGDIINIVTVPGRKGVTFTRSGVTANIINSVVWGSTFLQFPPGNSEITCNADAGFESMTVIVHLAERFSGV